jgi:hypothetical protein
MVAAGSSRRGRERPVNKRRDSLKGMVQRDMLRRYDRDDVWEKGAALRAALTKAWPTQTPVKLVDQLLPGPGGKKRAWTTADQFLVDEANSLLVGTCSHTATWWSTKRRIQRVAWCTAGAARQVR